MQKQWQFFSYIVILILLSAPCSAQVIHEDPQSLQPSQGMTIDQEMNYILDYMQGSMEGISLSLKANNFTKAQSYFTYYKAACDAYTERLSRLNLTQSDYEAIASNINVSRDELYRFIKDSEAYNISFVEYTNATLSGNVTGAGTSSEKARASYESLAQAYDNFRWNATAIEQMLSNNNRDTTRFENTLKNINDYMSDLSFGYNQPGLNDNSTSLRLAMDPATVPIGGNVSFTVTYTNINGQPVSDTVVNLYFNNRLLGKMTTDGSGTGSLTYRIPANISGNSIDVHAEALAKNNTRAFSNRLTLHIPDKQTGITLNADKDRVSYGDVVKLTGTLAATDGTPAPGKSVSIYVNDEFSGTTTTDNYGIYTYRLTIMPATTAGKYGMYTTYSRKPDGVFRNSTSQLFLLTVDPKSVRMTIDSYSTLNLGDMAHIRGTIRTDDDVPVTGADVIAYVDGAQVGNNSSQKGAFDVIIRVPENTTVGDHELYAAFDPGNGKALRASESDKLQVTFTEKMENIAVAGLPLVIFKSDTLYVNGTLTTGSGTPIAGKLLGVNASSAQLGPVKTDDKGHFNVSYTVYGTESPGPCPVTVYAADADGKPAGILYTGQTIIIPYDLFPAVGAPVLLIFAVIAIVAVFTIRSRPRVMPRRRAIRQKDFLQEKAEEVSKVVMPPWTLAEEENKIEGEPPAPFKTTPAAHQAAPKPGVVHPPMPRPIPRPKPDFSIEDEINAIKATIGSGDLKEALTRIYVASRSISNVHGHDIPDSMTHNEFYDDLQKKHPMLSQSLSHIVRVYEQAGFARHDVNNTELNAAINGLKDLYMELKKKKEGGL